MAFLKASLRPLDSADMNTATLLHSQDFRIKKLAAAGSEPMTTKPWGNCNATRPNPYDFTHFFAANQAIIINVTTAFRDRQLDVPQIVGHEVGNYSMVY